MRFHIYRRGCVDYESPAGRWTYNWVDIKYMRVANVGSSVEFRFTLKIASWYIGLISQKYLTAPSLFCLHLAGFYHLLSILYTNLLFVLRNSDYVIVFLSYRHKHVVLLQFSLKIKSFIWSLISIFSVCGIYEVSYQTLVLDTLVFYSVVASFVP